MEMINVKSKVFYTKEIVPEKLVDIYEKLEIELKGKVAVKIHSGEKGNQNYLRPEFLKEIIKKVNGTVVECNTAYEGMRNTTEKHLQTMKEHGWTPLYEIDILDSTGEIKLPINNGKHLKVNYVGKNIENYDSMLVISHFKGHPKGGYGGALKNISIGLASSHGKAVIHGAGIEENIWTANQEHFLESMAEAASAVVDYFKGNMVFINVMANMSVDCDCCAVAEDPCLKDMGILISLDPVAIDKACIDLVENSNDKGKDHFMERVNSRNGKHTIDKAEELKVGSKEYELIEIE